MRLDRLLANLGYGSRREVTALLKRGRLTTRDGKVLGPNDRAAFEDLLFEGEPLDPVSPLTLVLNKPVGYRCTTAEDEGDTVYDLLPPRYSYRNPVLSTVGRLDKDTSGLLMFTDDGALLHRMISPKRAVWKTYEACLARPLTGDEARLFASGDLLLKDDIKPCLPARLEVIDERRARLSIHEGRYHQVRRMFAAVGNHVESLERVAIGGLTLAATGIESGKWRALAEGELATILESD